MNITLTSLEALILKATNEVLPWPDPAAVEAFCAIMGDSAEGPHLAALALAARIHSQNPREAMLALTMLDQCMRRGDSDLQAEIGKFRFLNEMIKLVSPKYYADRTAPEVKNRVLQLFHAWAIEYPKENKFKVAYNMLKNQGVIKETPPPLPPEDAPVKQARAKSAVFEDEEKSKLLQKLLQSKKPEDLQHANRLIKTMVREEERRNEANSRRHQEVVSTMDSAGLLLDMLDHADNTTEDEEQLIHELFEICKRQRPLLQQVAGEDGDTDNLYDILHISDILDEVANKYNAYVDRKKTKTKAKATNGNQDDTLLDFAGANPGKGGGDIKVDTSKNNAMEELGDIFAAETVATPIVDLLKPVSLMPKDDIDLLGDKKEKAEGWNELDSLGAQLLKQSLPDNARRVEGFNSKSTKKIPMNALEKSSPKQEDPSKSAILDLDFFTEKRQKKVPIQSTSSTSSNDDVMVDISTSNTKNADTSNGLKENSPVDRILDLTENPIDGRVYDTAKEKKDKVNEVKALADINVTLDSVKPSKVPPLTVFEEEAGVTVVLHFCRDKPRVDVNVIVISTTSKKTSPIEDYKFQAVVPKRFKSLGLASSVKGSSSELMVSDDPQGCKIRLLTPSGTSLPACNPFLPPPALTQVMLLATPTQLININLKFIITYTSDDDFCSEIGEVNELPIPRDL